MKLKSRQHGLLHGSLGQLLRGHRSECVDHVERVLLALLKAENKQWASIMAPDDVVAVFRRNKLIPKGLYEVLKNQKVKADHGAAVCFAACAYPNRVRIPRWNETEEKRACGGTELEDQLAVRRENVERAKERELTLLGERVRCWWKAHADKRPIQEVIRCRLRELERELTDPGGESAASHTRPFSADKTDKIRPKALRALGKIKAAPTSLLRDLVGVPESANESDQEVRKKIKGAGLYLATCGRNSLLTMLSNWEDHRELVRFIREHLEYPPSQYAGQYAERISERNFEGILRRIGQYFKERSIQCPSRGGLRTALALERRAQWIGRPLHESGITSIHDFVMDCWCAARHKLVRGFPSYAFRSHYQPWWTVIVGNKRNDALKEIHHPGVAVQAPPPIDADGGLDLKGLHILREGYRLVRSTFFCQNLESVPPDVATTYLRRAIDCLFYEIYAPRAAADRALMKVKDIEKKYPELNSRINNSHHELKKRIDIYKRSRCAQRTNTEILDEFQPMVSAADGKRKRYATKKTPVETIASLSRVAEADHTLLWAFTCRVFLHPRYVNKQHPDRWSFRTWIAELAFWACEDLWDRIQGGQASGRTADSMAMRLLGHNGLGTLWNDLQSIEWGGGIAERWEKVDHWVDQNAERLSLLEEEMATLLHEFFGVSNWGFCSEEEFSKFNGMADAYWIIPAWYLVFVEGYGHTEVIEMLKPDPPEKAKVNNLVREMVRVRASSRGSAK